MGLVPRRPTRTGRCHEEPLVGIRIAPPRSCSGYAAATLWLIAPTPFDKPDQAMLVPAHAFGLIVAAMVIALAIIAAEKAAEFRNSDPK